MIGRAGIGVDNVDVPAATKRGIIVANAPQSNIVAAAEHTLALMLALARNMPQAHASLTSGKWERRVRRRGGLREDARRARLRADRPARRRARARAFGMRDPGLRPVRGPERFRELGASGPRRPPTCSRRPTSSRSTCPSTPETEGFFDAEAFAQCATACG